MKSFFTNNKWIYLIILLSIVNLLVQHLHNKFDLVDFEVYYRTALRMLNSEPIYAIEADGHFIYKYSPVAAILFLPFIVFPFEAAQYLYWILVTISMINGLYLLLKLNKPKKYTLSIAGFILVYATHISAEQTLGQVNILLAILYILILKLYTDSKKSVSAILLALSIFIKPFGLIFLPYFALQKEYKLVGKIVITSLILSCLPYLFYSNISDFTDLYQSWHIELGKELKKKQILFAPANHTIFSVIARNLIPQSILAGKIVAKNIFQMTILISIGITFFLFIKKSKNIVLHFFMLSATIPILAFTSANAFIYVFPLTVLLFSNYDFLPKWSKIFLITGSVFIGGNIYELWGQELFHIIDDASPYTFGTIFTIVAAIIYGVRNETIALETKQEHNQ